MIKKNAEDEDNNLRYSFNTALDFLQMAIQAFLIAPLVLFSALLNGKLGEVKEIAQNNGCTLAEAAALWAAENQNRQ